MADNINRNIIYLDVRVEMITLRHVFTLQFSDNFSKQPILVQLHVLRRNQHFCIRHVMFNLVRDMSRDKQKERKSNSFKYFCKDLLSL